MQARDGVGITECKKCRERVWRMLQWAVTAGEECGGYNGRQQLAGRSVKAKTVGSK